MKPSEISIALETMYALRRPSFIWGPPGVGKTDMIAQLAKKLGIGLIDFRMALRDPTDIKGFPMPDAKTLTMKFFRDGELPNVKTHGERGILFMDEMNAATPATQAAAMQLTLPNHAGECRIGDYVLPQGWVVFAAGNRETDRSVVSRMPSALANRFTHFDYELDVKDWEQWALANNITGELIAWFRFKENMLYTFDPKVNDRAFGTPRSWVATEEIVKSSMPDTVKYGTIKGTVGEGPGSEYWGFLRLIDDLPKIEEIKKKPKTTRVPEEPGTMHAVITTLGMQVTPALFPTFMDYIERMPVEFQATFIKDALKRDRNGISSEARYTAWALKNSSVIL